MIESSFIIPLEKEDNIWSFVYPLSLEVWIYLLFSIPIYVLIWGLLNYLTSRKPNWNVLVGFVLRHILVDHSDTKMPNKGTHHKALVLGWVWFTFIIVCAYAGNLTALIARPRLVMPIREAEDLLTQEEISWVSEDGIGPLEYMSGSPPGSTWRRIYDKIELLDPSELYNDCFTETTLFSRRHASLCATSSIKAMLHFSFSKHGYCDWYVTENTYFKAPLVMVFQVDNSNKTFYYLQRTPLI